MPLLNIECPICEFAFEADVDKSEPIKCDCCGHLFHLSQSIQVVAATESVKSPTAKTPPADTPATKTKRTRSKKQERHTFDLGESKNAGKAVRKSDVLSSSVMLKRRKAQRRSNYVLLGLLVGAVVSVALVGYRYRDIEQQQQRILADENLGAVETVEPSTSSPPPEQTEDPIVAPPKAPEPIQPPKFQFLSSSVAEDQAALMKPYLVLLEISSPAGVTYANGTIVDSRGFVVTSLPAVTGATSIKVSLAKNAAQIKDNPQPKALDEVRSVVAISKSQQWALLEINRRLVLNAADISIPQTDRIVSLQPLIRLIAPQSASDYAVSEMRVDSRKTPDDLTAQQKELLGTAAGDQNDDQQTNWILSPVSPYDRPGAALVSPDQKLMAVLVNSDSQFSYYIGAHEIAERLRTNSFRKMPLSSLGENQ